MAGVCCYFGITSTTHFKKYTPPCCSKLPSKNPKNKTPQLLKFTVSGITEILRIFSSADNNRTFLKLPWRPLIAVEGSTIYDLNDEYKIIRHAESWNISALEAVGQIFTPGSRIPSE